MTKNMSDTEKDQLDPMTKGTHGDIEQHDGDIPVKTEDTGDSHFQSESSNESLEHVSPQEPFASHHSAQYPFVKLDQQQQMQQLFQHQMLQMQQQQHLHQQQQSGSNIPMDAFLSSISSGFPSPSMSPDLNVQQQQMAMAAAAAQAVSLNMASLRYPNGFPLMMPTGSLAPGHPSSTSPTDPSSTLSSCGTPVKMETASPSMGSFNYQNHPVDGGSKYPFGPIVSQQRINSHNHPGSPPTSPFMTEEDAQQQAMAMSPSLDMSALSQGSFHPSSFPKSLFKTPMNYAPSIRRDSIGSSMGSLTAGELAMLDKEKPFKCPYPGCEARFPRMYNLKSHSLCHTGERPHVCPLQCGAKFARKHDLQRHMRTLHSPTRPFQCPFEKCQHAFRRANSFWRHLVEDHPDKSSQHSEIYQRAVHQQKMNQDAMAAGHMGVNAVHRDSTPPSVKIEHFQGHSLAQTAMLHSQSLSSMTSTPMPSPIDIPTVYNGGAHHPVGSMTSLDTSYMDPNHPAHAASSFHQNSHHLTLDQQQQLFVQVPRLDEGMIYRGHFSI